MKEYKIPTPCTQPLAITVDHNGIVWFAQTNTGKVAKFDPLTETFTEYDNPVWEHVEKIFIVSAIENNMEPTKLRSMMWGIDYFPDGSIWFTDERTDAIWKFSIDTESYDRISYSQTDEGKSSLPQKLVIEGSKIIINDFTGGRLSFLDYAQDKKDYGTMQFLLLWRMLLLVTLQLIQTKMFGIQTGFQVDRAF